MVITPIRLLVADLASYGEVDASERVRSLSTADIERVYELAFEHALTGMLLAKASCLAAIEVLEGRPRGLKRNRRDFRNVHVEPDRKYRTIVEQFERYAGGSPVLGAQIFDALSIAVAQVLPG